MTLRYLNDWIWLRLSNRYGVTHATHSVTDVYDRWMTEVDDGNPGVDLVDFYFDRVPDADTLNDAEYMYWSGNGVLDDAVLWLDAYAVSEGASKVPNLGWGGSALDAQRGDGSTASTFPKLLTHTGENYLYLPGVAGNYASTPDAAALDITGDIDIRVRVAMDDWTPSSQLVIFQRTTNVDPNRAWLLLLNTDGTLQLAWYSTGSSASGLFKNSTVATGLSDGTAVWLRVTLDVDNGATGNDVKFFTCPDQSTEPTAGQWVQLGTTVTTASVTSLPNVAAPLEVGRSALAMKVYRAQVLNGIGGTVVFDADFTTGITDGDQTTFVESSTNAATVTINRSTSGRKSVAVTRPTILFGTDDYLEVPANPYDAFVTLPSTGSNFVSTPDAAPLDITGDLEIVLRYAANDWTPPVSNIYPFGKRATTGNQRSWLLEITTGGLVRLYLSTDGANELPVTSTVAPPLVDGRSYWLKVTVDVDNGASGRTTSFFYADDQETEPTVWTQIGSSVTQVGAISIFNSTAALTVGRWADAGISAPGVYRRAIVRNGIGGTIVADWSAAGYAAGATSYRDAYGNVWSLNGTTSVTNPNPLNFGASDSFTVVAVVRQWATPTNFGRYVDKSSSGDTGWVLSNQSTNLATWAGIDDGPNSASRSALATITAGSTTLVGMIVDRTAQTLASVRNSTVSATTSTSAVGSIANALPMRVGALSSAAAGFQDFECYAVAVFRRALSADEIAAVAQYYEVTTSPSWVHLVQLEDGTPMLDESGLPIELE